MKTPQQQWSTRGVVIGGLIAVAVLVGGFGSWAVFATLSGAVVAPGQFEVERNRQIVQHVDGGVVKEILVNEGDVVTEGQTLVRLDPNDLRSQLVIVEGQLFEMMARRGRLDAERDGADHIEFEPELLANMDNPEVADLVTGQERLYEARRNSQAKEIDQLTKRTSQIEEQIHGIVAQQAAIRVQLELIKEELESQQSLLDRGLTQSSVVLNLRRTQASLEGELGELIASEAQSRGRITEIEIEILKSETSRREEAITRLRDLRYQEVELAETRRNLKERLSRLEITAPVSGIVYDLAVKTPRAVIRAAEPVLYLVPQDRPLVIVVRVSPTDIDLTYVGQDVSLRLPALDQRETPQLFGKVKLVSADAFQDKTTGASYYRAEVELNPGELSRLPKDTVLIPGMPVESYIRTGDHSPLAYLVKPFMDYFVRAFRET